MKYLKKVNITEKIYRLLKNYSGEPIKYVVSRYLENYVKSCYILVDVAICERVATGIFVKKHRHWFITYKNGDFTKCSASLLDIPIDKLKKISKYNEAIGINRILHYVTNYSLDSYKNKVRSTNLEKELNYTKKKRIE